MKQTEPEIAALKLKIKALEKENRTLQNIIYKAPIPLFVVNKNHTITHFNQALEELSGLSAGEMVGTKDQWKAFYKDDRPVMADLIIDQSSDEKIDEYYGTKYKRSSKEQERYSATDYYEELKEGRWLYFTASTFTGEQGDIEGAVETLQDVTPEKTAERKMKELFRIYRRILKFIPYPIVVYNEKGLVAYVNPAFSQTFGWSLSDLKGRLLPFVPEDLKEETMEMLNKLNREKSLTRYETRRLTRDNDVLDVVIWAASHARYRTGSTENFVILRDITEEKRIEANNKTIMRISAALPEYPGLEDLMDYISKEIKDLLKTEGAIVLLYDELKEEFFFTGASYDDQATEQRAREIRFPADSIMAGTIIKTGGNIIENDAEKLADKYPERDVKLGYKTRSLLEVPIKTEGRIIGVLCAINKKRNRFDKNDLDLMVMIAGTCALSIENARFADALQEAYRDVASMNRAKGKAINHLSHELKTPVAVLTGSFNILKKKLESFPEIDADNTFDRIGRNLNRVVEIQDEVADIMEDKTYSSQKMLLAMLEVCKDELETLIEQAWLALTRKQEAGMVTPAYPGSHLSYDFLSGFEDTVKTLIDEKFGPRTVETAPLNFARFFDQVYSELEPEFLFRNIRINVYVDTDLPCLTLPEEILKKTLTGLIKNAVENTPDHGRIDISVLNQDEGILTRVHDFGVGIEADDQKRIFEGLFTTQETLLYSTKTPFAFNAGGKGADLLRMKIFSHRFGFVLSMESSRCTFLLEDLQFDCPGDIEKCKFCQSQKDCLNSGYSVFSVFLPA